MNLCLEITKLYLAVLVGNTCEGSDNASERLVLKNTNRPICQDLSFLAKTYFSFRWI